MKLDEFIAVGKIHRPHGIRGWLKVAFNHPLLFSGDGDGPDFFFVGNLPKPLPYRVEELNYTSGTQFLLKLEELSSRETAERVTGKELYLTSEQAEEYFDLADQGFDFAVGYMILDETESQIGLIKNILVMPQQDLAEIHHKGKEVFIPLVADNIIALDRKQKTIQIHIPEGLLDL